MDGAVASLTDTVCVNKAVRHPSLKRQVLVNVYLAQLVFPVKKGVLVSIRVLVGVGLQLSVAVGRG